MGIAARPIRWALMAGLGTWASHFAAPQSTRADEPKAGIVKKSLTISPKAAEPPALRYRLFPLASERKAGDAAPMYLRLGMERAPNEWTIVTEKTDAWAKLSIDRLPRDEIRKFLDGRSYDLRQMYLGARRQSCNWNYALDDKRIIWILLPDAQAMRSYIRPLVAQMRLQIADGKFEAAAETAATGLAISQHIADGPFLINGLVGIATATVVTDALFDFVGRPDAPNLYWSLTALPRPLIDLRHAFETEQRIPEMEIPELADMKRARLPGEWDAIWQKIHSWVDDLSDLSDTGKKLKKANFLGKMAEFVAKEVPDAKRYLKETVKLADAEIEAMTATQQIVLHFHHRFSELRDDGFKALYLPAHEAVKFHAAAEKRLKDAPSDLATDLARHILPFVGKGQTAMVRLDRRIALLRVVEAIRMQAAQTGSLPSTLSGVTLVPIPLDPLTNKPFATRMDGTALVVSADYPETPALGVEVRIELKK